MCSLPRWLRWDPLRGKAGDAISDEEAIEAARQAQILETLTALPARLDTFLGTGGAAGDGGWVEGVTMNHRGRKYRKKLKGSSRKIRGKASC